ncbi:MAG: succinyl-diaminopimelate desuccinylase [Holosporaceae bacterium]|jgi:succinyl-diaminopimelate desuccinylase|nr:succinyl-diaminopimelate desuccinylase [Holosporaceae bacterium]
MIDVVSFCAELIKCKSVTPDDDGALDLVADFLASVGFETNIMFFRSPDGSNVVKNLFASFGSSSKKILGFLGHSDVVPPGDGWSTDPFEPVQQDGYLIGRGICDMKGGIGAFCCAVAKFVQKKFDGSIKILITGDEEIGTREGIRSLLQWCRETGNMPQDCIIGEPSSENILGDRIYLGHRGSINIVVRSVGQQGHVAYPSNFKNSLSNVCRFVTHMLNYQWKYEDKRFPQTHLEPTMLFTNNYAQNVVPDQTSANLNIRFSADYDASILKEILQNEAEKFDVSLEFIESGNAFYCNDEKLKSALVSSIREVTGVDAAFSASGGTSDGRYIVSHCNTIEFGLLDRLIHQKNEKTKLQDLLNLEKIYLRFLKKYFSIESDPLENRHEIIA